MFYHMSIYFQLSNVSLPISIESIGNQWSQISVQRPEGYPFYHWLQTEEGTGEIIVENKKILLNAGEGIFISPFVPHSYYPVGHWTTNFITFDGILKSSFSDIVGSNSYILTGDSYDFSFSSWIASIIQKHEENKLETMEHSVQSYQFLLQLSQKHDPSHQHHLYFMYVEPAIEIMKEQYNASITIEEIAEQLFISPQYLSRLFKRFINDSPYKYLINYRISRSKELLVNQNDLAIQEIAMQVGFDSPSQFNYLFKQKTGYTPGQFRKLYH